MWMGLILVETKLHILLVEWKVLMLQIFLIIVKRWVPYLKYNQQYAYHQ